MAKNIIYFSIYFNVEIYHNIHFTLLIGKEIHSTFVRPDLFYVALVEYCFDCCIFQCLLLFPVSTEKSLSPG